MQNNLIKSRIPRWLSKKTIGEYFCISFSHLFYTASYRFLLVKSPSHPILFGNPLFQHNTISQQHVNPLTNFSFLAELIKSLLFVLHFSIHAPMKGRRRINSITHFHHIFFIVIGQIFLKETKRLLIFYSSPTSKVPLYLLDKNGKKRTMRKTITIINPL